MKAYEIMNYLENYFPLHLQMDFDKCGLQIGDRNKEVNKVLIALNADNDTLQQCITHDCQMLITHHPFLLEKINMIDFDKHQGYFIKKAVENNIVVYSLHTCLDRGQNGISMNDWLIHKLSVENVQCYDHYEIGKMATLHKPMKGQEFIAYVKKVYGLKNIKFSKNTDRIIQKVAICGGSGADDLETVAHLVDCFITGDSKYRHAKYAIDNDCLLIDAGHHLEVIIEKELPKLLKQLPIDIVVNDSQDYYVYE